MVVTLVFQPGKVEKGVLVAKSNGCSEAEAGAQPGPGALSKVLSSTVALSSRGSYNFRLATALGLSSSFHRFTQNLSVFRRDVSEALRTDGSTEPCSLDMMS